MKYTKTDLGRKLFSRRYTWENIDGEAHFRTLDLPINANGGCFLFAFFFALFCLFTMISRPSPHATLYTPFYTAGIIFVLTLIPGLLAGRRRMDACVKDNTLFLSYRVVFRTREWKIGLSEIDLLLDEGILLYSGRKISTIAIHQMHESTPVIENGDFVMTEFGDFLSYNLGKFEEDSGSTNVVLDLEQEEAITPKEKKALSIFDA